MARTGLLTPSLFVGTLLAGTGLVSTGLIGCGRDDDRSRFTYDGEGGASTQACHEFCVTQKEADCGLYVSIAECHRYECRSAPGSTSTCLDAIEVYYECMEPAAEVCNLTGCTPELEARHSACQ